MESSDHNATSFTEADKRVKRRLLMGNGYTPHLRLIPGVVFYTIGAARKKLWSGNGSDVP